MKKLLAIMMALVMCCSLVISASAADTYSGLGFDITIDVDGEWEDYGDGIYDFYADDGTYLEIYVYSEDELGDYTTEEAYNEFLDDAYEAVAAMEEDEVGEFAEGEIAGYDAFILEELYDDYAASLIYICTDNYLFEIGLEGNGDDDTYNSLADSVLDITIFDDIVEDDTDVDTDVDEDVDADEDADVDADADADADEDEDKPSKNDKKDKNDKDADKDDKDAEKADKDAEEDDENDNTTLIIIIVAGVAVVAIAAVVIVLVTKKKK